MVLMNWSPNLDFTELLRSSLGPVNGQKVEKGG